MITEGQIAKVVAHLSGKLFEEPGVYMNTPVVRLTPAESSKLLREALIDAMGGLAPVVIEGWSVAHTVATSPDNSVTVCLVGCFVETSLNDYLEKDTRISVPLAVIDQMIENAKHLGVR